MATEYRVVLAALLAGVALSLIAVGAGRWLRRPDVQPRRVLPFEHGGRTAHKTWVQFRVRYAVLALVFVAFDMEMVYMFPWAVVFRRLGLVAFLDMFVFIAILTAAIVLAWKKGAFEWED